MLSISLLYTLNCMVFEYNQMHSKCIVFVYNNNSNNN